MAGGRIENTTSTFTSVSTELFDPSRNSWRLIDGKLPGSKTGLRMITTFYDNVFIFGIYRFFAPSGDQDDNVCLLYTSFSRAHSTLFHALSHKTLKHLFAQRILKILYQIEGAKNT